MMAAITHPFMSSDNLSTPGFFTAAINADELTNPFEASFKAGTATLERAGEFYSRPDDHQTRDFAGSDENKDVEDLSPLFAFSPRMSPSMYEHQHLSISNSANVQVPASWGVPKMQDRGRLGLCTSLQVPSPPNSVKHSPEQWHSTQVSQSVYSPLHQILTQNFDVGTRIEYGQFTPPDDECPADLDDQLGQREQLPEATRPAKRKRGHQAAASSETTEKTSSKRQRKSGPASKSALPDADGPSAGTTVDPKRSKFLERNRVAASKCRQKKKEWTSNLEVRARDLQTSKNQLTVVVASLKEEILFLKGELLKHSTCGCSRIRDYLDREVATLSHDIYGRVMLADKASPADSPSKHSDASVQYDMVKCEDKLNGEDGSAASPASSNPDVKRGSATSSRLNSPPAKGRTTDGALDALDLAA